MSRIVFLLEERSMAETLRHLLPKVFSNWKEYLHWIAITHNGKSDLEMSIPRKLQAWNNPGDRFVIVRDNDGADCCELKVRLLALVPTQKTQDVLVRIVCQELEGWFIGDLNAVDVAYPRASERARNWIKNNPDTLTNAASLLSEITGESGKITKAKCISPHMNPRENRSRSLQVFLKGVEALRQRQ